MHIKGTLHADIEINGNDFNREESFPLPDFAVVEA